MTADNFTIHLEALIPSWKLSLRAKNLSPRTIEAYELAALQLNEFLKAGGLPTEIGSITRQEIRMFLDSVLERRSPATAKQRYASLVQLFKWAEDEGEIGSSPMGKVRPPRVPEQPVPIVEHADLVRLLSSLSGNGFEDRRDAAIIHLLADSGMRLGELAMLKVGDIDLDLGVAIVRGKGAKVRSVPFGKTTAQRIDRYLRARRSHRHADHPWLWLGLKGRLGDTGISQMVKRRGQAVGIDGLHPHRFRHTFAHEWLAAGGQEGDLQRIAGWADRQMLNRYGASAAAQRALDAHQRYSPVERL